MHFDKLEEGINSLAAYGTHLSHYQHDQDWNEHEKQRQLRSKQPVPQPNKPETPDPTQEFPLALKDHALYSRNPSLDKFINE